MYRGKLENIDAHRYKDRHKGGGVTGMDDLDLCCEDGCSEGCC
jgi:hypothetical protein